MNINTKTMHISLPESLIESAKIQAEEGQYGNVSDYVRSLIRKDVRQREEDKLERMLLEGVRSGRGGTLEEIHGKSSLTKRCRLDHAESAELSSYL
jgi:antitoxin ParD1/3/4